MIHPQDLPDLINEAVDESSDSSEEENWLEEELNEEKTTCLFCKEEYPAIETAIDHLETVHKFNLAEFKSSYSMDSYSYIQVRFIRHTAV